MSPEQRSYANMALSFRGAERQAPCLFLVLTLQMGTAWCFLDQGQLCSLRLPAW